MSILLSTINKILVWFGLVLVVEVKSTTEFEFKVTTCKRRVHQSKYRDTQPTLNEDDLADIPRAPLSATQRGGLRW